MSLMKTLTRVAIGIVIAKGVQHVTSRSRGASTPAPRTNAGTGRSYAPDTKGMGGIMDEILNAGKSRKSSTRSSGGLDDLLGTSRNTSRTRSSTPKGGLGDLLGSRSGGGGLGDLLGAVLGGAAGGAAGGAVLGQSTRRTPEPEQEDEAEAAVLLRAMIMAAKSDGTLDDAEKAKLMDQVGDATRAEIDFINAELSAPVDIDGLLRDVPRGMEEKVYMVSLMAIDLDERAEAEYLHQLAQALGLSEAEVNALHDHAQAPRIYS